MQEYSTDSRILVVDDETTIRSVIAQVLADDGYAITEAGSAEEALGYFREQPYPLVITDIVMNKMTGLELLKELKVLDPDVLVVVMTSHASLDTATSALRSGAYDYLTKPFDDLDSISQVVARAIEKKKLADENQILMQRLKKNAEELRDVNRSLRDMAMRDGLTGLYNHRYFREALQGEISRSQRHGRVFSLVFMDVDHFKQYNDSHGHLAGDELLKALAQLLNDGRRASTIAARYGGEEFVLLVPETSKQGASALAESVRARIQNYPFPGRGSQPGGSVTLSLGVAAFPEDGADANELISAADRALYAAKNAGRNSVR